MDFIELEAAIEILSSQLEPQTKTKIIPLNQILNHHAANDIYAPIHVPPFNRSAMDGYAVNSCITKGATRKNPVKLKVLAQLVAGTEKINPMDNSQAVRIMTGAPMPDEFDAVVKQEDTNYGDDEVEIYAEAEPYMNYAKIGEDIQKDRLIIKKATRLMPIHSGILATLGIDKVEVFEPLKIGLICSGSELVELGQALQWGQIYDSNRYLVAAKLQELNVELVLSKKLQDNSKEIKLVIEQFVDDVDMFITTGGVSVGVKDIMHDVVKELGAKRLFWRINMRPGASVLASVYRDKPILSLSGNPSAALTAFELLFRPMLSSFMQTEVYTCKRKKAVLMNDYKKESKQRRLVQAYYENGQVFLLSGKYAASILSTMQGCNCLIDLEAGTPPVQKGEKVEIIML